MALAAGIAGAIPVSDLSDYRNAVPFTVAMSAAALAWGWLALGPGHGIGRRTYWGVAVLLRALALAMVPSVDLYRYFWEGQLVLAGFNPYALAPDDPALNHLRGHLWELIPQNGLTTPYPPLAQIGFATLVFIFGPSILAFKLAFVLADLATCWLLEKRFGPHRAVVWAWNPVIIYSFAGGGHFDSWFVATMVAAWLVVEKSSVSQDFTLFKYKYKLLMKRILAAFLLGASIALKWVTLPIAAWWLWKVSRFRMAEAVALSVVVACPFAISYAVVPVGEGAWAPEGFARYARSAEAVPRWIEAISPSTRYDNSPFGIVMAVAAIICIFLSFNLLMMFELWLFLLFLLSPVVHFWYLSWLLPFAVASRNPGTLLASASFMIYFLLHGTPPDAPGDHWRQSWFEHAIMWAPFMIGMLLHWKRQTDLLRNRNHKLQDSSGVV